jgi:hypothetical protein
MFQQQRLKAHFICSVFLVQDRRAKGKSEKKKNGPIYFLSDIYKEW